MTSTTKTTKDDLFDFKSDSMTAKIPTCSKPHLTVTTMLPKDHPPTPPSSSSTSAGKNGGAKKENACVLKMIQIETVESLFGEMQLSSTMILDHLPGRYEWILQTMAQNT